MITYIVIGVIALLAVGFLWLLARAMYDEVYGDTRGTFEEEPD